MVSPNESSTVEELPKSSDSTVSIQPPVATALPAEVQTVNDGVAEMSINGNRSNGATEITSNEGSRLTIPGASSTYAAYQSSGEEQLQAQLMRSQAKIVALEGSTAELHAGMQEILSLLKAKKEDEAMSDIESLKMPAPSVANTEQRVNALELRELSNTSMKVPIFVGASDLALRAIWKDVELWVLEVTSLRYRNSLSTFEAVRQLLNANVPKPNHPAKFEVFRQIIQEFITKDYREKSGGGIDEDLWKRYSIAFKAYLMPDVVDEKNALHRKVFNRTRARQTSIMSAIALFKHNVTQLAALENENLEGYLSQKLYNTTLLQFLDLGDPCMESFRRRLCKKLDENFCHSELLHWLQNEQGVEKLVLHEKSKTKKTFMMESYETENEYAASEIDLSNVKEIAMPGTADISTVGDYHHSENQSDFSTQKVFLGTTSFEYDSKKVLSTYFGEAKNTGINRFPNNFKKSKASSAQNRKNLVQALAKQVGSSCTRCLRPSCSGSTTGWRDAPCAQEGSENYVSYALCQALFHLVKFMFGDGYEENSKVAIKNFYLQKGQFITTSKPSSIESMRKWMTEVVKTKNSCYMGCFTNYANGCHSYPSWWTTGKRAFSTLMESPQKLSLEGRCLRAMPDLGCPEYIAGLCWWNDYRILLQDAGLLDTIGNGQAPGTYAFGDSMQKPACYRLLQVPLFYRKVATNNSSSSVLVFANITIVDNAVGLLNGKTDLSALEMTTQLKSAPGASKFWIAKEEVLTDDVGSHFWMLLETPRSFSENETGLSLQRSENGRAVAVKVSAKKHHAKIHSFDKEVCVLDSSEHLVMNAQAHGDVKDLKNSSVETGILGEILGSDGSNYDTDSEYEYDEEHDTFIKVCSYQPTCTSSDQNDSHCAAQIDCRVSKCCYAKVSKALTQNDSAHVAESEYEYDEGNDTFVKCTIEDGQIRKTNCIEMKAMAYTHKKILEDVAFSVALADVEMSKEKADEIIARLWDLHRSMNHPAPSQLLVLLQNSLPRSMTLPASVVRAIRNLNCPRCAKNNRHNRVPERPRVSASLCLSPGQVADMDVGTFESPSGKFDGAVHVDEFSLKVSGGICNSAPTAEDIIRTYVQTIDEHYDYVLFDLDGCFDSRLFQAFLEKQGITPRFVPTGAHWANKAEKAIELLKVELASVFVEFPGLTNELAFKLAILNVNRRVMPSYKMSRLEIHWGRKASKVKLEDIPLCSLTAESLPPTLADIDVYLNAASWKRSEKSRKEARLKIRQALQNLPAKEQVQLRNGDEFLIFHNDPVSKNKSGFRGIFTCLGQVRSLIVGMKGRYIVTAHPSRVLLHKRGMHNLALDVSEEGILPETRTLEWEVPLDQSEKHDFQRSMESKMELTVQQDNTIPISDKEIEVSGVSEIVMADPNLAMQKLPGVTELLMPPEQVSQELPTDWFTYRLPALNFAEDESLDTGKSVVNDTLPDEESRQAELDELLYEAMRKEDENEPREIQMPSQTVKKECHESQELSKKRGRNEGIGLEFPSASRQRIHARQHATTTPEKLIMSGCPKIRDVSLENRMKLAKQKYMAKSGPSICSPNHGLPQLGVEGRTKISDTHTDSEIVYLATKAGMRLRRVYLCDTSRKRTIVHDYDEAIKLPGMKEAMELEIATFKKFGVLEETLLEDLPGDTNLITTRWILSTKTNPDGSKKQKARLVARGFEDSEKENISRDSPVASNATQRMVLQLLAEKQWIPQSFDFLSAFLQGKLLDRIVVIAPPTEFNIPAGVVWVIKKPIYGICSAPKAWYDTLIEVCQSEGFDTQVSDEGILRLRDQSGMLVGILALHVDDAIGGGTQLLSDVMEKVGEKLKIGSHETAANERGFFYKGLRISVTHHESGEFKEKFEINLDGDDYLDSVLPMNVPAGEDETELTAMEAKDFRSVAGSIGYMASAFRVDLSVETSMLGRDFFSPTIKSAKKANAIVKFAKENRYTLTFRPGVDKVLVFADAAGPSEKGSQGGRIYCFTDKLSEKIAGFAHWESRKNSRVCKSTSTAEILTVGDGLDSGIWLRQLWYEMTGKELEIEIITDSNSTLKNSTTTKLPLERRNRIDMALLRQALRRGEYRITWVPSKANISDPLTKENERGTTVSKPDLKIKRILLDALRTNNTQLRGVQRVTRTKEDVSNY